MALTRLKKFFIGTPPRLAREDAMKIFRRDRFRCQYCGLDGLHQFTNWMILTIDYVHPYARGGSRKMSNLVTCCQPCNVIKGKRQFATFDSAKEYVLKMRHEWRHLYEQQVKSTQHSAASIH